MRPDVGHGLFVGLAGLVLLALGAGARAVDKAQSRSRVLAVLIGIVALAFGGFVEMWLWAGAGFLAVGVGLVTGGGAGATLVAVGVVLFIVGFVRLVLSYPRRRRSAKARLADVDLPMRRGH